MEFNFSEQQAYKLKHQNFGNLWKIPEITSTAEFVFTVAGALYKIDEKKTCK